MSAAPSSGLSGEVSFARMRELLPQADALAAGDVLDLSSVTRMDSAGAAFLLELTRRAARQQRALRLHGASPQVKALLEFLQIDKVLTLA